LIFALPFFLVFIMPFTSERLSSVYLRRHFQRTSAAPTFSKRRFRPANASLPICRREFKNCFVMKVIGDPVE
jgi:hypothetical protein